MKKKLNALAILLAMMIAATVTVYAAYDSTTDPLISKSYLDQVQAQVDAKVAALSAQITALSTENSSLKTALDAMTAKVNALQAGSTPSTADLADSTFSVIKLTKGQKIICNKSSDISTELILRSGEAAAISAYDSTGQYAQGLSDLTDGSELYDKQSLKVNHYMIVPRGDGRGVRVTSDVAYFLIRGPYEIVNG